MAKCPFNYDHDDGYAEAGAFLMRFFLRRGVSPEIAQDLVQDALIVFWKKRGAVRPGKGEAFLASAGRNLLRAYRRKHSSRSRLAVACHSTIMDAFHATAPLAQDVLTRQEQLAQVGFLLDLLPARMSLVLRLRCFENLSRGEIATRFGVTRRAVAKIELAGLRRLRRLVSPKSDPFPAPAGDGPSGDAFQRTEQIGLLERF